MCRLCMGLVLGLGSWGSWGDLHLGTRPLVSLPMGMEAGCRCRIWIWAARITRRRRKRDGHCSLRVTSHMRLQNVMRPGPGCCSSSVELSLCTLLYLKGMLPNVNLACPRNAIDEIWVIVLLQICACVPRLSYSLPNRVIPRPIPLCESMTDNFSSTGRGILGPQ